MIRQTLEGLWFQKFKGVTLVSLGQVLCDLGEGRHLVGRYNPEVSAPRLLWIEHVNDMYEWDFYYTCEEMLKFHEPYAETWNSLIKAYMSSPKHYERAQP